MKILSWFTDTAHMLLFFSVAQKRRIFHKILTQLFPCDDSLFLLYKSTMESSGNKFVIHLKKGPILGELFP